MDVKKVFLSGGALVFAIAVIAGGTGAFFSSMASSKNNSFTTGTLDLALSATEGGAVVEDVTAWEFTNMVPGGDSESASVWLRNTGSITGESIDIQTVIPTESDGVNGVDFAKQMRITKLELDGVDLLRGGAGYNNNSYEAPDPDECDIEVNFTSSSEIRRVSVGLDGAGDGDIVCVGAGGYGQSWESGGGGTGYPITIDKNNITLVSMEGPDVTTLGGGIEIDATGVTVKGFEMVGNTGDTGLHVKAGATNAHITYNNIVGWSDAGIRVASGATDTQIDYNTIINSGIGIDVAGSVSTITLNYIANNTDGVWLQSGGSVANLTQNNILDNSVGLRNDTGGQITAPQNWWGTFKPVEDGKVAGDVVVSDIAGGPFIGWINGEDYSGNGYADLHDLTNAIEEIPQELSTYDVNDIEFIMDVQLDMTTGNTFKGKTLSGVELEFTLHQI